MAKEESVAVVRADVTLCQGYANCVDLAPDVFDIDDDGVVVLLECEITDANRARIEQAVQSCPVSALSITEE